MANYTDWRGDQHHVPIMTITGLFLPLTVAGIVILGGLMTQSLIVAVNVTDWLKKRSMTAADQIITSLGITRVFLHVSCLMHLFSDLYFANLGLVYKMPTVFTWVTSSFSSIWLSALLSFFFCFKISTFHNVFFLCLKTIMSQRVTCLCIASVLLSSAYASINVLLPLITFFKNSTEKNASYVRRMEKIRDFFLYSWNIFPVGIYFVSSVLLIISLGIHISKMRNGGHAMSSAGIYHKTITFTMVSFLTCAFYVLVNLFTMDFVYTFGYFWLYFTGNFFPFLHSISIVYVNTRLRTQFSWVVHCVTGCLRHRKTFEPNFRARVEVIHL